MTVANGSVARLQNEKDLGNTTIVDNPKTTPTERESVHVRYELGQETFLGWTRRFLFGANLFCAGGSAVFDILLQLQQGPFLTLSVSGLPPCSR